MGLRCRDLTDRAGLRHECPVLLVSSSVRQPLRSSATALHSPIHSNRTGFASTERLIPLQETPFRSTGMATEITQIQRSPKTSISTTSKVEFTRPPRRNRFRGLMTGQD